MNQFKQGDDVIVTEVQYFGRKTIIWRGTFQSYGDGFFNVLTDEGEMSFINGCGLKAVESNG